MFPHGSSHPRDSVGSLNLILIKSQLAQLASRLVMLHGRSLNGIEQGRRSCNKADEIDKVRALLDNGAAGNFLVPP